MTPQTAPEAGPQSPYLAGNYAPVHTEITATDLRVEGEIPRDLCGDARETVEAECRAITGLARREEDRA